MNKYLPKIELITNILIIVVIIGVAGIFIKRNFFPSNQNNQFVIKQPVVGSKINLADQDFSKHAKTLILVLQTNCHYCNESAPFYQKIVQQSAGKNINLLAVLPTSVEESQAHLNELSLSTLDVRQAPLNTLPVSGTPTLILTNERGEITNFWIGKLSEDKEQEVIDTLER